MVRPEMFVGTLKSCGVDFYTGVPDSLLKNICAYITDNLPDERNVIAANEGGAMGIAAGYYLATGKVPVVYMQNSGEGNVINPLASLADKDVYGIPVLLVIGWRGRPGLHDEPQHVKQGKVTTGLLNVMGVDYSILSKDEDVVEKQIRSALEYMHRTNECYALVVEKDTFEPYKLQRVAENVFPLSREEAIQTVAKSLEPNACVVSTTGMISRELFEYRTMEGLGHERDFLTVGSMGHASQIALGIALQKPAARVYCFDGDGASIMHMGNMAIAASMKCTNYVHVVFNNGAHDSVGGQPTVGLNIDLCGIAKSMGYVGVLSVSTAEALQAALDDMRGKEGPLFLQVCVHKGSRKDLGRPTTTPVQNKEALMGFLKTL